LPSRRPRATMVLWGFFPQQQRNAGARPYRGSAAPRNKPLASRKIEHPLTKSAPLSRPHQHEVVGLEVPRRDEFPATCVRVAARRRTKSRSTPVIPESRCNLVRADRQQPPSAGRDHCRRESNPIATHPSPTTSCLDGRGLGSKDFVQVLDFGPRQGVSRAATAVRKRRPTVLLGTPSTLFRPRPARAARTSTPYQTILPRSGVLLFQMIPGVLPVLLRKSMVEGLVKQVPPRHVPPAPRGLNPANPSRNRRADPVASCLANRAECPVSRRCRTSARRRSLCPEGVPAVAFAAIASARIPVPASESVLRLPGRLDGAGQCHHKKTRHSSTANPLPPPAGAGDVALAGPERPYDDPPTLVGARSGQARNGLKCRARHRPQEFKDGHYCRIATPLRLCVAAPPAQGLGRRASVMASLLGIGGRGVSS